MVGISMRKIAFGSDTHVDLFCYLCVTGRKEEPERVHYIYQQRILRDIKIYKFCCY